MHKEGTKDWKKSLSNDVARHARAFDQIAFSLGLAERLRVEFDSSDIVMKSVLFVSMIIHYARPFTKNKGNNSRYWVEDMIGHDSFSIDVHNRLMQLRDQLVAHQDGTILKALVGHVHLSRVPIGSEGSKPASPVRSYVVTQALMNVADKERFTEIYNQISTACEAVDLNVKAALAKLNDAEVRFPDTQPDDMAAYGDISVEVPALTEVNIPIFYPLPGVPQVLPKGDGYHWRYRTLWHALESIEEESPTGTSRG